VFVVVVTGHPSIDDASPGHIPLTPPAISTATVRPHPKEREAFPGVMVR